MRKKNNTKWKMLLQKEKFKKSRGIKNKYKNKKKSKKSTVSLFEHIQYLIFQNLGKTFVGLAMFLIIFGSVIIHYSFEAPRNFFNNTLQTSLVSELQSQISAVRSRISAMNTCKNTPWQPLEQNVCRGVHYNKFSDTCNGFNAPRYIETVGSKICCEGYDSEKMLPCLGADIFLDNISESQWRGVKLVGTREECRTFQQCQFYPDPTKYHAKVDPKTLNYIKDDKDNIIIEKNCESNVTVSACDKDCGGGKRTVSTKFKNCIVANVEELCNVEPCFSESVN